MRRNASGVTRKPVRRRGSAGETLAALADALGQQLLGALDGVGEGG